MDFREGLLFQVFQHAFHDVINQAGHRHPAAFRLRVEPGNQGVADLWGVHGYASHVVGVSDSQR